MVLAFSIAAAWGVVPFVSDNHQTIGSQGGVYGLGARLSAMMSLAATTPQQFNEEMASSNDVRCKMYACR